jgi:hypothetical protein
MIPLLHFRCSWSVLSVLLDISQFYGYFRLPVPAHSACCSRHCWPPSQNSLPFLPYQRISVRVAVWPASITLTPLTSLQLRMTLWHSDGQSAMEDRLITYKGMSCTFFFFSLNFSTGLWTQGLAIARHSATWATPSALFALFFWIGSHIFAWDWSGPRSSYLMPPA